LIRSSLDFAASVTFIFVKISFENESTRILELLQIFARKKVRSSTFRTTDFFCLKQRLRVDLAVYSSRNIAFNRSRRFEEIRSDLFPLFSIVSPFVIYIRKGKKKKEGEKGKEEREREREREREERRGEERRGRKEGGRESRMYPTSFCVRIFRASFRKPPHLHGKLQSAAKRGRMLNFREKLCRAVTRRHGEYAPRFSLNSTRDKLQISTALSKRKRKSLIN